MTPREYAESLLDQFLGQCASDNGEQALILAKNCAEIVVNEILKYVTSQHFEYFKMVQTEIRYL